MTSEAIFISYKTSNSMSSLLLRFPHLLQFSSKIQRNTLAIEEGLISNLKRNNIMAYLIYLAAHIAFSKKKIVGQSFCFD